MNWDTIWSKGILMFSNVGIESELYPPVLCRVEETLVLPLSLAHVVTVAKQNPVYW